VLVIIIIIYKAHYNTLKQRNIDLTHKTSSYSIFSESIEGKWPSNSGNSLLAIRGQDDGQMGISIGFGKW